MAPQPPDFDRMFTAGARYRWSGEAQESVQEVEDAGGLRLGSGWLVACDPKWGSEVAPFTVRVDPGIHPVSIAITCKEPPEPARQVSAVKVVIREAPVVSWQLARTTDSEDPSTGFGVDSGLGCFLDATAAPALLSDTGQAELSRVGEVTKYFSAPGWVNLPLGSNEANVVVFKCPMGDGVYPTWMGLTASREVACFIAHPGLLNYSLG